MARLLAEFPEVFDAYWTRAAGLVSEKAGKPKRRSFSERREAARAERMGKAARRR